MVILCPQLWCSWMHSRKEIFWQHSVKLVQLLACECWDATCGLNIRDVCSPVKPWTHSDWGQAGFSSQRWRQVLRWQRTKTLRHAREHKTMNTWRSSTAANRPHDSPPAPPPSFRPTWGHLYSLHCTAHPRRSPNWTALRIRRIATLFLISIRMVFGNKHARDIHKHTINISSCTWCSRHKRQSLSTSVTLTTVLYCGPHRQDAGAD